MFRMMHRRLLLPVLPQRVATLSSAVHHGKQDWREVVADFQRKTGGTNASLLSQDDVTSAVLACTANNRTHEALDVIRRAEKCGVATPLWAHVQVCCSMARKGQADRALERMKELRQLFTREFHAVSTTKPSVYDPLLSVFKKQGDWSGTHATIGQMDEFDMEPSQRAFRVLMLTAAKAGRKDDLLTTISFVEENFPGVPEDATLTAMCQALVEVGDPQRALKIFQKLETDWLQEHASTMLYNQFLLAAFRVSESEHDNSGKGGNKEKKSMAESSLQTATRIFEQMQSAQKAVPDDFTFATYIMGLGNGGQWDRVLDLFSMMIDLQARNEKLSEPPKPVINALACSTVIRALHKHSDFNQQTDSEPQEKAVQPASKKLSPQQRKLKQGLSVVLKQLRTINLRNIGHASTLVDTLDEFKLYTPARQVFQRMLDEDIIQEIPWRQKDGFEIDLHTFSKGVAKCAVVSAFEEIIRAQKEGVPGNAPMQNLRIITGVGNRSHVFLKPVLKQEITDMLKNSCRPSLWVSTHPTNAGVLVLRHNRLRKWIEKGGVMRYF